MFYSRAHYRLVSPPADTPADIAARRRHYAALDAARADREAMFPTITVDNFAAVNEYQNARIAWHMARLEEGAK